MEIKGVITGDIIKSRNIKAECRDEFWKHLKEIEQELANLSLIRIEVYRGDGFQILVDNPIQVLRVALLLRAKLRSKESAKWDARLAIGVGEVAYQADTVSMSDGEAYSNSGWEFDELGKRKFSIRTPWKDINDELRVSTAFVDDIVSKWTFQQASVIYTALSRDVSQKQIAEDIGKKAQNVNQLLRNAKEGLLKKYLERYEQIINFKTLK